MELNLEALGISKEDLQERVVERLCDRVLTQQYFGQEEDEESSYEGTTFARKLNKEIEKMFNSEIEKIGERHVLPKVLELITNHCIQKTNQWGEKIGESRTFTEYLVDRAEAYLEEAVDYRGDPAVVRGTRVHSWKEDSTRLTYEISRHLQFAIERSMKEAMDNINKSIVGGLEGAVKIALQSVVDKTKIEAKVGR